jgi:UPF0271 protein
VWEFYPDLTYEPDGTIVIERIKQRRDPDDVAGQVRQFLSDGEVMTSGGTKLHLQAQSICVHSDGPNAPEIARAIREAIQASGWEVRAPGIAAET